MNTFLARRALAFFIAAVTCSLVAFSQMPPPPPADPGSVPADPALAAPPPPPPSSDEPTLTDTVNLSNSEGFIYDPTGRRDPFVPPKGQVTEANPGGPLVDSLEIYDLSQLKVVGIMWGVNDPKAMIRAPNGKVFMAKKNSKIGRNKGFVALVREGEIVVFELSADGRTPATQVMSLQK